MANQSQQSLKMYVLEGLLSSFKLVTECQTHPEDQISTCVPVIGYVGRRILGKCGSVFSRVCMASKCKWQASMRVASTAVINLVFVD